MTAVRPLGAEEQAVDAADAGDHAVGRGVGDQVLQAAAARLRGNRERAVFDEAAFVAQVGDVLARGAPALGVALGHGVRAGGVERCRAWRSITRCRSARMWSGVVRALAHRRRGGFGVGHRRRAPAAPGPRPGSRRAPRSSCAHAAGLRGAEHVLHLHGFQHGQLGCRRPPSSPTATLELHQAGGHGRAHGAFGRGWRVPGWSNWPESPGNKAPHLSCSAANFCSCGQAASSQRCAPVGGPHLVRGQGAQQRQVGGQAVDAEFGQRALRAAQRIFDARRRVHDELGQQRVVVRRGRGAGGPWCRRARRGRLGRIAARQGGR
jgi:hypothetical protein